MGRVALDQYNRVGTAIPSRVLTYFRGAGGSESSLKKNAGILLLGTVAGQALSVLFSPVISRLYSPADFGVAGLVTNMVNVFSAGISGRYEMAINQPSESGEARAIMKLALLIAASATFFLLLAFLVVYFTGVPFPGRADMGRWILTVPLLSGVLGFYQIFNYWHNREKAFPLLAKSRFMKGLGTATVAILIGFLLPGPGGLILASLAGTVAALFVLRPGERWSADPALNLRAVASKYSDFPKYNASTSFFDSLSLSLPVFIFAGVYSKESVGFFTFTSTILGIPVGLLSSSLAQSLLQKLGEMRVQEKNSRPLLWKLASNLFLVCIPGIIAMWFLGPMLFEFVFGPRWRGAGEVARLLAIVFAVRLVVSPLSVALTVHRQQKALGLWKVTYFVSTALVLAFSATNLTFWHATAVFAAHETLFYSAYLWLIFKFSK